MKKLSIYLVVAICMAVSSCDSALNLQPGDRYSATTVWGSKDAVDKYVIGFYSILKESSGIYNAALFDDAYSDLMKSSSWDQYNHSFNYVLLQETTINSDSAGPFECWTDMYTRIRRYNEFLRDAPSYKASLGEEFVNTRTAEVMFMRAFAYFRLIRVYGGVVIRSQVDGPDANNKARATEGESWNQALSDIRFAAENLPASWDGNGRITKAAAYGMMSRIALFAKQWQVAAEAAEKCAESGGQLYKVGANPYETVMNSASNVENLIVVNFLPAYSQSGLSHRADIFFRPVGDSKQHGNTTLYGAFGPTSELADEFEVKNASGEWEAFSWERYDSDPYENRDPRFYSTILYNGAKWEGRRIETFVDGTDGIREFATSGTAGSTTTGYYFKKFLTEGDNVWETKGSYKFGITLRYAEVLLNKAEALAELDWDANSVKALEALNEVRSRAGMSARNSASKEEFMSDLRHERIVELAGEGFRYWDLRRWRLAEDVINGKTAHGVKITKDSDGNLSYERIDVDGGRTRVFFERFYAFSIPVIERSNNTLLGNNNPGW